MSSGFVLKHAIRSGLWIVHLSHGRERNEAGFLTDVIVDVHMESVGD